jgi:transposase-like protein
MTGRVPLTEAEKQQIYQRKQGGATHAAIAHELGCSAETVRKWWRYYRVARPRRRRGRPSLGALGAYPDAVRETCLALKRAHAHWGPANVRIELQHRLHLSDAQLPSLSRLAVLFKTCCPEAVQPRRRHQYPERSPAGVTQPHQRWQIDGKEKVPVGAQDVATILEVRDPVAALMLAAQAFITTTEKAWRKLTLHEVQTTLRATFTEWGLPLAVQTDHEEVYTGAPTADFPSLFTLWLVGLGIEHVTSRNRRPTDQPHVERNHRTLGDMAWKDQHFADREALQASLDAMRHRHNYELPVHAADCAGRPPLVACPEARFSGRPYHPDLEWTLFDIARVDQYLASRPWVRQISESGCVSLGRHLYAVGRAYKGQTATARFVPATHTFHFQLADGTDLGDLPAVGLDKADIIGFAALNTELQQPTQPTALAAGGGTILQDY